MGQQIPKHYQDARLFPRTKRPPLQHSQCRYECRLDRRSQLRTRHVPFGGSHGKQLEWRLAVCSNGLGRQRCPGCVHDPFEEPVEYPWSHEYSGEALKITSQCCRLLDIGNTMELRWKMISDMALGALYVCQRQVRIFCSSQLKSGKSPPCTTFL